MHIHTNFPARNFFNLKIFIYLFGHAGSLLRQAGSSVVACERLSWGMWNLAPWPGIKPEPFHWKPEVLATDCQGSPRNSLFSPNWKSSLELQNIMLSLDQGWASKCPEPHSLASLASIHSLWGNAVKSWALRDEMKAHFWAMNVHCAFLGNFPS